MALKINLQNSSFGIGFDEAYARILQINMDKNLTNFHVVIHASQGAREESSREIDFRVYSVNTEDIHGNIFTYLYNYLKTLQEYAGAEDV